MRDSRHPPDERRRRRPRAWLRGLIWLLPLLAAGAPRAARADARVVAIDPHDAELVKRVDGQTQDLPIKLRWVSADTAPDLAAIAREQRADLVVQVARERRGGRVVHVYDAKRRQLRTRAAPEPQHAERFSSSSAIEAAALIVRGEIKAALAADGDARVAARAAAIGGGATSANGPATERGASASTASRDASTATRSAERQDAAAPAARPDASTATRSAERQDAPVPAPDPPRRGVLAVPQPSAAETTLPVDTGAPTIMHEPLPPVPRFGALVSAGLTGDLPTTDAPMLSGLLGARVRLHWAEVGLSIGTSLRSQLQAADATIELRRSAFGAELAGLLPLSEQIEAGVGVGLGLVFYARSTQSSAAPLRKTPDHTSLSPSFGPQAELRWRCTPALRLAARAGISFVPRATRFAYDGPSLGDPVRELGSLAFVEPWVGVAMLLDVWQRP